MNEQENNQRREAVEEQRPAEGKKALKIITRKRITIFLCFCLIAAGAFVIGWFVLPFLVAKIGGTGWASKLMALCAVVYMALYAMVLFWRRERKDEKRVCSYSDVVFLTLFVLAGFAMGPVSDWGLCNPEICAWVWICTGIICILAVCRDMGKILVGFLVGLVIVLPLANFFIKTTTTQHIDILGEIHRYLADMNIMYQGNLREAGFTLSMVFGIIILCSIVWTKLDRTHKIESLTVRRFRFPAGTAIAVSGTRNADSDYPNLFKTFMGGLLFGDIVIQSPDNKQEWYRIRNVFALPFRIKEIQDRLQTIPTKGKAPNT